MPSAETQDRLWIEVVAQVKANGGTQDDADEAYAILLDLVEAAEQGDAKAYADLVTYGYGEFVERAPTAAPTAPTGGGREYPFGEFGKFATTPRTPFAELGGAIGRWWDPRGRTPTAEPTGAGPTDEDEDESAVGATDRAPMWKARLLNAVYQLSPAVDAFVKNMINMGYTDAEITRDVNQKFGIGAEGEKATAAGTVSQDLRDLQWARANGLITEEQFNKAVREMTLGTGDTGMTEYQRITAGQAQERLGMERFGKTLEAARTANPLTYLAMIRGAVPGAGGTDLYEGIRPVIPTVGAMPGGGAPPYREESVSPNFLPTAAGVPGVGSAATGLPSAPGGLPNVGMQPWSPQDAAASAPPELVALVQKYFPPDQWENALAVSQGESGWNPTALNQTPNEYSQGYFQINRLAHPNAGNMLDPEANVAYAAHLYNQQGWQPWTVARNMGLAGRAGQPSRTYNNAWVPPPLPEFLTKTQAAQPLGAYTIPAGVMRPPGVQQQAEMSDYQTGTLEELVQYQGMPLMDWRDYLRRLRSAVGTGIAPASSYGGSLR